MSKGRFNKLDNLVKRLRSSKRRVDWHDYAEVFKHSASWEEIENRNEYDWFLTKGVPISLFPYMSKDVWSEDPDLDDDAICENEERYEAVESAIDSGDDVWPIVVAESGFILDGYHRLAVMNDMGFKTVDVLWSKVRS